MSLCSFTINSITLEEKESQTIADFLSSTTCLKELKLNFCSVTLKILVLQKNSIGDGGAVSLSQALHWNSTLQELYLNRNCIKDEGAIALAQSLHQNNTLQILDLSSNSIGDEGAPPLVPGLHKNHYMQRLDWRNIIDIGERVASEFVQALVQNSSIKQIILSMVLRGYFVSCPNYNEVVIAV